MIGLVIGALAITGAIAIPRIARASGKGGVVDVGPDDAEPDLEPGSAAEIRGLAEKIGAPPIWQDMFAMIAYGESRLHTNIARGVDLALPPDVAINISEPDAKAAARSFEKNASWLAPCWPAVAYSAWSGGWFQMFPASGLAAFKDDQDLRCTHPWALFDPPWSIIMAAWFARRLTQWKQWKGTVVSLRRGWGQPAKMGEIPDAKREKWGRHCQSVGLAPSFLDKALPAWKPDPPRALFQRLGVDPGKWLPPKLPPKKGNA